MNKDIYLNNKELSFIILIFIGICLALLAGFRPLEHFRDTEVYITIIHSIDDFGGMEPTLWIINQINLLFLGGKDQIFFLIYAILGVSIKIYAINKLSLFPLLSIYVYICLYFVLHEMTQIRVGVASAIFLLAISDIVNRNFLSYFFKTLLAITFHYSAVVMILLYFIDSKKINNIVWFFILFFGLVLSLLPNLVLNIIQFLEFFLPTNIAEKINTYLGLINDEDYNKINIFNIFILSLVCFYYIILLNIYKLKSGIDILLVKLLGLQLFVYFAFSVIPTISMRLSDFIGITLIITLANFIAIFEQRIIPIFLIILWLTGYLYFIVINKLIIF